MRVRVKRLPHGRNLPLPAQASPGSSGFDLRAAVEEQVRLESGAQLAVPTGIALGLPPGWEGQVRPRSGLARRHGVTVLNAPGTVDSDYLGEVWVLLINHGPEPIDIRRGDRIAQIIFTQVADVQWREVDDLGRTDRGEAGFGSTGIE